MNSHEKQKWDERYSSPVVNNLSPCEVLSDYQHLLPQKGMALDLACGRGANAICLAKHGLSVSAWDISSNAIEQLDKTVKEKKLNIKMEVRDVITNPPEPDYFDVIVVCRFLERTLIPNIRKAIKSGGLIFYQTFIKDKISETGPSNPDYLLNNNELLSFFHDWRILLYREEGNTGNLNAGFRNQAMLVAQKF